MNTLAKKLKKALDEKGLNTLRKAEKSIGISHTVISRILNGDRRISREIRNKLISLSKEITIKDFEEPIRRGAKKKSEINSEKDLSKLIDHYSKKQPTYADELRQRYLS